MDDEDTTDTTKKQPSLIVSLIPILTALVLLLLSLIKFHIDIQIPLIIAATVAGFISVVVLKNKWADVEKGISDSIMNAMQAILICCIIGLIIGSWIAGGIVPSLIYYGLKILSPRFFLVTCLLVCSIISVATGSSWTTCGTMGVAMIGIGMGMGIPAPVTAGAVVSGAYFGDKMSPFSDTTNLAPAVAGTTLFAHIRHMIFTTGVSYIISIVVFMGINLRYVSAGGNYETVNEITSALADVFTISPIMMLPVVIIIVMIVFKTPAIPGLIFSVILGILFAVFVQGYGFADIGNVLGYGFEADTGNVMLDELLTRGGLQSMMWTVSLILCALTFGGIMYSSGMLETIARNILKVARDRGGLITATVFTAICINLICGEQYLSILITGKMYKEEYRKRGLAPQNLSRCLEDAGTITSPLIPWTTCATAISGYLGVATLAYFPYAIFCLVNPIVAIIFGFTGITMKKLEDANPEDIVNEFT